MSQRTGITFRASAELVKALADYSAKEFCSRGDAVATLLEKALATTDTPTAAPPQSVLGSLKEQEAQLRVEALRRENQRKARELLRTDEVVQVVESIFGAMRVQGLTFAADIARDFKLDQRTIETRFLATMSETFSVDQLDLERLADNAATEKM